MDQTIVVCGYGPGISEAVARKFGSEGYRVAVVARTEEKVQRGAAGLAEAGIEAKGFACDLGDPAAVRALVADVRSSLGPIGVVHWNAYVGLAGDLLECDTDDLRAVLDVGVVGAVAAVQAALPDLRAGRGSVLVTGGGLAFDEPQVNAMAVQWKAMGLAMGKAAQHKLVGLLSKRLEPEGVFVGEVIVLGAVKGTAFDSGRATLEPSAIAERFWEIHRGRTESSVRIS